MRSIKRGFRNFYRHPLRNLVVIILLFVCLTFSLSMLAVKLAADSQIEEVKQSVGNYGEITVSSDYQMSYFEEMRSMDESERQSQSRTMTEEEMQAQRTLFLVPEETADLLAGEPEIVTYDKVLSQSIALDDIENTAMQSMLGMRNEMRGGEGGPSISSSSFTFEGNTNGASAADFLTGDKALVEGSFYTYKDYLEANPVVVIEENLAEENELGVGDTITATISGSSGKEAEVELTIVGIYQTVESEGQAETSEFAAFNPAGNTFYAPLSVVQLLSNADGYVSRGSYYFDSVDSTGTLTADFTADTGGDTKYAFTTDYSSYETIADPLQKTAKTSTIGLLGALGACALIIILAMSIIVGGRTRELGVLKAIGATDRQVIAQFAVEVVCICLVAIVLASGVTAIIGQKMGDWLMNDKETVQAETATQTATNGAQGGPPGMIVGGPPGMGASSGSLYIAADTSNTDTDLNVVYRGSLFGYGILILFIISLLGMAVPVVWITRLRPARVLSME
jgi:putative ABC transport system permease protein